MTWFEDLTGFREVSAEQVRENIRLDGDTLTSLVNGKTFTCGRLEIPSLESCASAFALATAHPDGSRWRKWLPM